MEHHRDRFAQAAGEWRDMSFGERIPYEDMARADKERHQKDLDIATRNLNAALVGSVQEHGACCVRAATSACMPDLGALFFYFSKCILHHKKRLCFFFAFVLFLVGVLACSVFFFYLEAFLVFSLWKELSAANLTAWCDATLPLLR